MTESRVWELQRPGIAWLPNYPCSDLPEVYLFISAEQECVLPFSLCLLLILKPPMLVKGILFLFLDAKGASNHNSLKLWSHETNSISLSK